MAGLLRERETSRTIHPRQTDSLSQRSHSLWLESGAPAAYGNPAALDYALGSRLGRSRKSGRARRQRGLVTRARSETIYSRGHQTKISGTGETSRSGRRAMFLGRLSEPF